VANEITVKFKANLKNGFLEDAFAPTSDFKVTQATALLYSAVQIVGTSAEAIVVGDIATLGYAIFHNLDPDNFVLIGPDSGGTQIDLIKLKPGDPPAAFRLKPGITVKAKFDTAPGNLRVQVWND
jgi:hypothetical protein